MTWRVEEHVSIDLLLSQNSSSSSQSSARRQWFFVSKSAVNQNASINKNSKSSISRSLRQHTLAKSISFCCFYFYFAREIDRSLIQIFKCLLHSIEIKILNKILILVIFAYIYFRSSRTSSAFVFISSRLSHLLWNFQLQQWSVTISTFQSMNFFAMSIDQENSRFETKLEEDEKIVLRACLRISRLRVYFISESSYEN